MKPIDDVQLEYTGRCSYAYSYTKYGIPHCVCSLDPKERRYTAFCTTTDKMRCKRAKKAMLAKKAKLAEQEILDA